jgi:hypothetical protein
LVDLNRQYSETPMGRRLFVGDSFDRTLKLWSGHQRLLHGFRKLPSCFCHHDAFRKNLMARHNSDETVAIDWAITGFGRIGEEIGITTAISLSWMTVPASQAKALDEAVFSGYIEGLSDAGWRGDVRMARFGYTVNAFLIAGAALMFWHLGNIQKPEESMAGAENPTGLSRDEAMAQWSEMQFFLMDLGDEAYELLETHLS